VFADLVSELAETESEQRGRPGLVAPGAIQRLLDVLPFEAIEHAFEVLVHDAVHEGQSQVGRGDALAGGRLG